MGTLILQGEAGSGVTQRPPHAVSKEWSQT